MKLIHTSILCCVVMWAASCSHGVKPEPAAPVRVQVQVVDGVRPGAGMQSFSGTVEAATSSMLSFNVPGTITTVYVSEGQRVSRGQTLARLRADSYDNSLEIAQAQLAEAEDAYNRMKKLHDADALPDMQWVAVQNQLKQARSAVHIASQTVRDAAIVAPYDGVVAHKLADAGQSVVPTQPVLELVTASDLNVCIAVPETEIGAVASGAHAVVSIPSIGVDSIGAAVTSKSVTADPLTRAYEVKIALPHDSRILPGMVCDVQVAVTPQAAGAEAAEVREAVLPTQAVLLAADNRTFVWVVKDGRAEQRFVRADRLTDGGVAVSDGLAPGDSVIVAGMPKVGTGTRVSIAKS